MKNRKYIGEYRYGDMDNQEYRKAIIDIDDDAPPQKPVTAMVSLAFSVSVFVATNFIFVARVAYVAVIFVAP